MDRKNQRILAAALLAGALFLCAFPLLRTPEAAEAAAFLPETPVTVMVVPETETVATEVSGA